MKVVGWAFTHSVFHQQSPLPTVEPPVFTTFLIQRKHHVFRQSELGLGKMHLLVSLLPPPPTASWLLLTCLYLFLTCTKRRHTMTFGTAAVGAWREKTYNEEQTQWCGAEQCESASERFVRWGKSKQWPFILGTLPLSSNQISSAQLSLLFES
jgi:hypothetical protein